MEEISFKEFQRVKIVAGTVVQAETFPKAKKPAYKIWVDFGPYGIKKTSAQVTKHYTPEDLVNRKVIACINLGTRNIAGFISEFLLLGFSDENQDIILASADLDVPDGSILH